MIDLKAEKQNRVAKKGKKRKGNKKQNQMKKSGKEKEGKNNIMEKKERMREKGWMCKKKKGNVKDGGK